MKLKACTDFMSWEFIQIFSLAINHSHYSYRTKLITAEDRTFHLVTSQSLLAVSTDIETRPSLAITITTPGAGPQLFDAWSTFYHICFCAQLCSVTLS